MNRTKFLKVTGISLGGTVIAGTGFWAIFDHKTSHQPLERRAVKFVSLEEAHKELAQLEQANHLTVQGQWNLYQNLIHCAQSIEYSYQGYPSMRSALFQGTIGALAWNKFSQQGFMSHNLNDPIPAAPAISAEGEVKQAFSRLKKSIEDFQQATQLKPHFAYGKLSKSDYAKAHAMHLADHFSAMEVG